MFHVHENACKHVFMRFGIDSGESILTGRAALFACFFVSSFLPSFLPNFGESHLKKSDKKTNAKTEISAKKQVRRHQRWAPENFFRHSIFFGNQFSQIFQINFYRIIWISKGGAYGQNFSIFSIFFFSMSRCI